MIYICFKKNFIFVHEYHFFQIYFFFVCVRILELYQHYQFSIQRHNFDESVSCGFLKCSDVCNFVIPTLQDFIDLSLFFNTCGVLT